MSDHSSQPPVLEITGLCLSYYTRAGEVPAVYDFDLTVAKGESVGLVGESGCGKSTVANGVMRYMGHNGDIVGGTIKFKGRDMAEMSEEEIRRVRGKDIAMIYQEPMASLNPSLTIGQQLMEVPIIHEGVNKAEAFQRAYDMLSAVHIPDPKRLMISYPHQVSGGQQQRVVIAMALLSRPALLLLDEPTTALDVTVEAGIVELIAELSRETGSSLLYISHNLGLMLEVCDRICVMYSGEVVEEGTIDSIFSWPKHPYTQGLFGCIPLPHADKNARPLVSIKGQLPLPHERPEGCNFGPRCGFFEQGRCDEGLIPMEGVHTDDDPAHRVRCMRWEGIDVSEAVRVDEVREPIEVGETVLEVADMRKYYKVRDRSLAALVSGGAVREVKANESISFPRGRGRDGRHRGRIGLRQVHVRQGADGAGDRNRRRGRARRDRPRQHPGQQTLGRPARLAPDGVPEPERHAQPVALGRLPDRPGDQALRHRARFRQAEGSRVRAARHGEAAAAPS